jgi:hypothetical protein
VSRSLVCDHVYKVSITPASSVGSAALCSNLSGRVTAMSWRFNLLWASSDEFQLDIVGE